MLNLSLTTFIVDSLIIVHATLHSAAEGRFRGLVIQNFLDMVGFYMLVKGYPEVFGHQ